MVGHVSAENVRVFTETPHANMSAAQAAEWVRNAPPRKHAVLRELKPGDVVIEAGCGAGFKLLPLATLQGATVIGVDGSPEQLRRAKETADALGVKAEFVNGWLEDFAKLVAPYPRPNLIVCSAVLHHVAGWESVLDQFRDVLPSGGKLFLTWCDPTLSLAGFNIKNQIAYRLGWNAKSRRIIGAALFGWWDRNRNGMKADWDSFFADLYSAYYIPITGRRMARELSTRGFDIVETKPPLGRGFFYHTHRPRLMVARKR